jgi:hypothetical protein
MISLSDLSEENGFYSGLSLNAEGEIRLVKILESRNGVITCELRVVSLIERPAYIAISYTWGPSTNEEEKKGVSSARSHRIICNGYSISVTENLYNFLNRATDHPWLDSCHMWIDIICINQSDLLERTSQVKLMATIYSSANTVVAWLGEEDEHIEQSFGLIKALGRHDIEVIKRITPRNFDKEEILAPLSPCGNVSHWNSLAKFFQRRYFSRVWIIQEMTLATNRLAVSGRHTCSWDDIVIVSHLLTVTSWTRWLCTGGKLAAVNSHQSNHTIPNLIESIRRTRAADERKILLYSLIRARRFMASNPRDKVYALLGIAGCSVLEKAKLAPIYDIAVADTYTNAASQVLEDSEDLLLLAHAEGNVFQQVVGLPSWVPDWSCTRVVGLGVCGYLRFAAAGDLPKYLQIHTEEKLLVVKGFKLDEIISIGESKEDMLKGKPFPRTLSLLCSLPQASEVNQQPSEVFWRTLITNTSGVPPIYPAPLEYGHAFADWIRLRLEETAQYIEESLLIKTRKLLGLEEVVLATSSTSSQPLLSFSKRTSLPEVPEDMVDADSYEAVLSHSPHLRPFLTTQGYFGLGSESVQEKDSVWIIAGSRVPLMLRQTVSNAYKVVGGAFVYGFMNGEALNSNPEFQQITLA